MRKRAAALVLALALSAGVLSGCRTTEPGPTEPTVPASATAPEEVSTFSETAAIPTEDLSQDPTPVSPTPAAGCTGTRKAVLGMYYQGQELPAEGQTLAPL